MNKQINQLIFVKKVRDHRKKKETEESVSSCTLNVVQIEIISIASYSSFRFCLHKPASKGISLIPRAIQERLDALHFRILQYYSKILMPIS